MSSSSPSLPPPTPPPPFSLCIFFFFLLFFVFLGGGFGYNIAMLLKLVSNWLATILLPQPPGLGLLVCADMLGCVYFLRSLILLY
jgi:hypothetical protein